LNTTPSYTFNKKEKLKSRKLTEQLFASGKSFLVFPVKVMYLHVTELMDFPVKIGVSVSSKKYKKAVDRNRIKRVLRENYRLNKHPLIQAAKDNNQQIVAFFLYIDKALPDKTILQRKMPQIVDKLITAINENTTPNT